MKLFILFSIIWNVLCFYIIESQSKLLQNDFLVVYDYTSKSFRQISLISNETVDIASTNQKEDIQKIIIEKKKDYLKLYYSWPGDFILGILEIKSDGTFTDKRIKMLPIGFRDFDKDPSQDVFYLASVGLFRTEISNDIVKSKNVANAAKNSYIYSVNYDANNSLVYFLECTGNVLLRRYNVTAEKELQSINIYQCLNRIFIDFEAKIGYGIFGGLLYSFNPNEIPKIYDKIQGPIEGFAIGSKHLYFTVKDKNIVYQLEKNNSKEPKEFYKFAYGNLKALAVFEKGDSGASNLKQNLLQIIVPIMFIIMK